MTMRTFAHLSGDRSYVKFGRASALADACLYLVPEPGYLSLPVGFPIGIGLFGGPSVEPCVFAYAPGVTGGLTEMPLAHQPRTLEFVREAFGDNVPDWIDSIIVVLVNLPELQLGPGHQIQVGNLTGACGTDLTWPGQIGVPAFATAGHVAQIAFNSVLDNNGAPVGSIGYCSSPNGSGLTPVADFAVVDRMLGVSFHPRIPTSTNAGAGNAIIVGPRGNMASVSGFCVYFSIPSVNGVVGEVYLTNNCVTNYSDSGSPALFNGDVIGHVVGAVPGMTSIIQCIDYQLQAARKTYPGIHV